MKIKVNQAKLARALSVVSKVASGGRGGLPILNNVLIRAQDKKVTLTATNLDMAVVDYLPTSDSEDGVITVPARLLADYAANLPKGEVVLETEGDILSIDAGGYHSKMNGVKADEFPELPEIDETKAVRFLAPVDDFKAALMTVKLAASNDTSRPTLTGVLFETRDGDLNIVASDGYRLAFRKFISKVKSEVRTVVPAVAITEVLSALPEDGEVEILFDETQVRFRFGEIEVTSKLIDGSFPDYSNLWPRGDVAEDEVDRVELVRIAKLALLFARSSANVVTVQADAEAKELRVSSVLNEYGENTSKVKMEGVKVGMKTSVNGKYLIDALGCLTGDKVAIRIYATGQILVEGEDYRHMIMPTNRR